MVAELRLDQTIVTGLTDVVKAPVVESLYHLALLHTGVQAAVGSRAILRVRFRQLREALLALVTLLKLLQQLLGLLTASFPGGILEGIGADVLAGGPLGHNQHMAHIHGLCVSGQAAGSVGLLVGCEVILHLLIGGSILFAQVGEVHTARVVQVQEMLVIFQIRAGADIAQKQRFGVFKAVHFRRLFQIFHRGIQLCLHFRVQLVSGFLRLRGGGLIVAPAVQGTGKEELLPGAWIIRHGAGLHIQRLGGIHPQHRCVGTIAAEEVANLCPVEHLKLAVGQGVVPHTGHHGILRRNNIGIGSGVGALGRLVIGISIGRDGSGGFRFGHSLHGGVRLFLRGNRHTHPGVNQRDDQRCQHHHSGNHQCGFARGHFLFFLVILAAVRTDRCSFRQLSLTEFTFCHEKILISP